MWNARLDESQAGIKIVGRNINNLRYADDSTLKAESEEEPKSFLMKKKENEKAGLKLNTQKTKIMASGPIISWQTEGEKWKQWQIFFFPFDSKITVDSGYGHGIKRHLLLERKTMINLDNILKSGDITLLIKVHPVKAMVFPVVMYKCEGWVIKKAEHLRTDAFELWC